MSKKLRVSVRLDERLVDSMGEADKSYLITTALVEHLKLDTTTFSKNVAPKTSTKPDRPIKPPTTTVAQTRPAPVATAKLVGQQVFTDEEYAAMNVSYAPRHVDKPARPPGFDTMTLTSEQYDALTDDEREEYDALFAEARDV